MCGTTGLVYSLTSSSSAMCACASMMPGVTTLPPASITFAPAPAFTFGPASANLPLRISTLPLAIVPWVTVMILALRITTSAGGFQVASIAARLISSVGAADWDLSDCDGLDFESASDDGCCANVSVASSANTALQDLRMCISGLLQRATYVNAVGL